MDELEIALKQLNLQNEFKDKITSAVVTFIKNGGEPNCEEDDCLAFIKALEEQYFDYVEKYKELENQK